MRISVRTLLVACLFLSASVFAQESASVVPFTLDISRTPAGFTKKEGEELTRELPRALRAAKVNIPTTAVTENAMVALKRQDCDRDDSCLQQLAQKAETLYAMYVSIDFSLDKNVIVAGRVVSDDGNVVRRQQTVTMPKGAKSFTAAGREAMARLIDELELSKLPATRAVVPAPPQVSDVPAIEPKTVVVDSIPAPPMVEAPRRAISRTAAYVIMGSGLAAVIGGGVILLTAPQVQMEGSNVYIPDAAKVAGTNVQRAVGWPVLGLGVAAVAAGAVLWGLSPASSTTVSAVPLPGGGVVSVGGTFH